MPKFYFHYRTDDGLVRDTDGRELPDIEAAEHNAAELGKAIVEKAAGAGEDTALPRSIEITDDQGEELLYVVFWAAPEIGDGSAPPLEPATLH